MTTPRATHTRRRGLLSACAACVLYTASLPPFDLWWLAFVAPFPLALVVLDSRREPSPTEAIIVGLVFGELTTLAVGGYWLFHAANGFFARSVAFSTLFTLATTLTHAGLFLAAIVVSASRFGRLGPGARIFAFGGVWVASELIRANILYGCPWDFLGHAFSGVPVFMQAAGLGGVYLLSWLCATSGAALAVAYIERGNRRVCLRAALLAFALPVMAALHGYSVLTDNATRINNNAKPLDPLVVGLVQANVGRHELWEPKLARQHLETSLRLSRSPQLAGVDLIVWAENAVPFLLDANSSAQRAIQQLADQTGAAVLLGAPRNESAGDGTARFFNSLYFFKPGAQTFETYDKARLLPYVESTPAWARKTVGRPKGVEYTAGTGRAYFEINGWRIAPMICFESTYPEIARGYAAAGANLLINVSNDSWFNRGAAPQQHFAMTVLRAAENGLPLVRVANTGVSAMVDSFGRVTSELDQKVQTVGKGTVVASLRTRPLYSHYGDWFAILATLVGALGVGASLRKPRVV